MNDKVTQSLPRPHVNERVMAVARAFRDGAATPQGAADILDRIAQDMDNDAAELAHTHQDRSAGRCWREAARGLRRVSRKLWEGGQ